MLGRMGSGMLRQRVETRVKSKKAKLAVEAAKKPGSGRDASGLSSSLVFTPIQGLELPAQAEKKVEIGGSKYFSATQGFKTPAPRTPKPTFNF